jgi:penicillin-binding protein activator
MKICKKKSIALLCILVLMLVALVSCTSAINVDRIGADTDIDLSGNWNDTDIRIVAEALVGDSLKASWIEQFRIRNGRDPVVIIGRILNRSSEHIDTSILSKRFELAFINTGRVQLVADVDFRETVREEREEQQYFASEESAKALGKEIGADFLLQGAVRTNIDQVSGTAVRTYYVSAELIDIETSRKVWVGEETVRKLIKQSKYRL